MQRWWHSARDVWALFCMFEVNLAEMLLLFTLLGKALYFAARCFFFNLLLKENIKIIAKYYVSSTGFPEKKLYSVCLCVFVLTTSTFLKAGIGPIAGKQWRSEATQNPLSWLSIAFHRGANNTGSSPRLCQKQFLCVVWRISIPRCCLEWEALPELIKMLACLASPDPNYSLLFQQKR